MQEQLYTAYVKILILLSPKYMRLGGLKTEVDIAREGEGQAG
jgi:hypothetical protein